MAPATLRYMPEHHWPSLLRQIYALEASWNAHKIAYPREDAVHWLPLPIPQFIALLTDAVRAAPTTWEAEPNSMSGHARQTTFIDVGCGPGTKARLAQAMFGLDVTGIDIVPEFVSEAQALGIKAGCIDAFDFNSYDHFDIVFANRPSTLQDEMETRIMTMMAPQTVLIAANWRNSPASYGFEVITMEYERPVCGVFKKS